MSNNSSAGSCAHSASDDAIVATVWGILLVYGFISNALVIAGIYRNVGLKSSTSYWLIASLAVCDIFMIIISLTHLIPSVIFHDKFLLINETRNYVSIFFYNIFWYTEVLDLGAMALNRFVSILFPMNYITMFSKERTVWILVALHLGGLSIALPALFECCQTIWNHVCYLTHFKDPTKDSFYGHLDYIVDSVIVLVMVVCYAAILWRVRQSRLQIQRRRPTNQILTPALSPDPDSARRQLAPKTGKHVQTVANREIRLFLQFFVVSIVFTVTFVTWQIVWRLGGSSKWQNFAMTCLYFINNATNPTVYLIYNQVLRGEVRNIIFTFCPKMQKLVQDQDSDKDKQQQNQQRNKSRIDARDGTATTDLLLPKGAGSRKGDAKRGVPPDLNSTHV